MGRCPDGLGSFDELGFPTYGYSNYCPEEVYEKGFPEYTVRVMPNPAMGSVTIEIGREGICFAEIYNPSGDIILTKPFDNNVVIFNISGLRAGIYFYKLKDKNSSLIASGKFIVLK